MKALMISPADMEPRPRPVTPVWSKHLQAPPTKPQPEASVKLGLIFWGPYLEMEIISCEAKRYGDRDTSIRCALGKHEGPELDSLEAMQEARHGSMCL